jgi:hypothetical protein
MLKTVGVQSVRTGNQTINNGDLIIGTAGDGIDFSANANVPGMTSELLNWYEEGTFTPTDTSGAGLTFTNAEGRYTRIGRMVFASFSVTYPVTVDVSSASVGLPFTSRAMTRGSFSGAVSYTDYANPFYGNVSGSNINFYLFGGAIITNNGFSGLNLRLTVTYEAA